MTISKDERHRYGQHYTRRDVATLLAAFAVRAENDIAFDPSCGDGRLLAEALRLKRELAPRRQKAQHFAELYGADRSPAAVELAAEIGARIALADFFDIPPGATLTKSIFFPAAFDA